MKNEEKLTNNDIKKIIDNDIHYHINVCHKLLVECKGDIEKTSILIIEQLFNSNEENKLILFGNGGSASDSQHIAAEFTNRYSINRRPLPAIAITTDTSALTAISNDFSFDEIFSKQIKALGRKGDIAIGISTSGTSPNVLEGLKIAKNLNIKTILLTSTNLKVDKSFIDISIKVPAKETARIQEMHILIGHIICKIVDKQYEKLYSNNRTKIQNLNLNFDISNIEI